MTQSYAGSYPIETRRGEIERLLVQGAAISADAGHMLDLIDVEAGWRCLDVGCGPLGITDLLSARVGSTGQVVGLDMNDAFLDFARASAPSNVTFATGDAYNCDLDPESFDLVHMRFIASTAGDPDRLIAEALRLVRPGGVVALQEPDGTSLHCYPPHPAWDVLKSALMNVFAGVGADLELARRLYWVVRQSRLEDVQFRPFIVGVRSMDPMVDYLPSTVESLRGTVLKLKLMSEADFDTALAECRQHLSQPDTAFTMYTVAQVWGRKPACA